MGKNYEKKIDDNFLTVNKEETIVKHRFYKRNKFFSEMDKHCSNLSKQELEVILTSLNRRKKEIMEREFKDCDNPQREFRTLMGMIRDWKNRKSRETKDECGYNVWNYQI